MSILSPSPKMNVHGREHQKVQKLYLKSKKERHGMKKSPGFNKSSFYHINVYQLQRTGIINYSEVVNNDIICPNNLMFSNNTKCSNRSFYPNVFAINYKTYGFMSHHTNMLSLLTL